MLIRYDPDEYKGTSSSHTCPFHQLHPGESFAGCTCSASFGSVRRSDEEIRAIKAERRRKEEDEILAKAAVIKASRAFEEGV